LKAPQPKFIPAPACESKRGSPATDAAVCEELAGGAEGWVELGFMVDTSGNPFEITVVRSTGNKVFDKAAARAIERSTFVPGSLGGKPIESGFELKYRFLNGSVGASRQFIGAYGDLMHAINATDKPAADVAMAKIRINNLYENAYFGLASYIYATKWGDESQQLEALKQAIAEEDGAHYLPKDQFRSALYARMKLEVQAREYAEALITWKRLQKLDVDKSTMTLIQPIVDQLQKLRSDGSTYAVPGLLTPEGRWYLHLFKRHFSAVVNDGYISQVKLRCEKHYVFFAFDPSLQYEVDAKYGDCSIELLGAPGTHFQLVQS
jgi:TonB family protein